MYHLHIAFVNKILTVEFLESTKRFDKPLFSIASTFHEHMRSFSILKMSMCCGRHHEDAILTLEDIQLAAVHS